MATYSQTRSTGNVANDAEFRTWGKFFSDSLEAAGWTKTADTGQINWTTVTKPVGTNTAAGYEVRKSPTLGGSQDLYVKLEFGTAGGATNVALWHTLGTGSNGAGTLTGVVTTRTQVPSSNLANAAEDLVSATGNYFALETVHTGAATSNAILLVVERLTDADGAYLTDGWIVTSCGINNGYTQSLKSTGVFTGVAQVGLGYIPPSYAGSGGVVMVGTAMPNTSGAAYPMLALLWAPIAHAGSGVTHSIAIFPGLAARTYRGSYLSLPQAYTSARVLPSNVAPLILWE